MFNKNIKIRQNHLDDCLFRIEKELNELILLVDILETSYIKQQNRLTFMEMAVESLEMNVEVLESNMKMKKKGNK